MKYKLTRKLVRKSKEAFLLGLELYNKPTIDYRAESFSLLFSNAWELLLKAYIYETERGKKSSIFRRKERNKKRLSISLDDCLIKIFKNDNDPIKRNIEYISEIRNEAAHLIVQELYPYFSRAFQSGIINYIIVLRDWFNIDLNNELNPGLLSLVTDKGQVSNLQLLKSKYTKEDFNIILDWINKFNELQRLGDRAAISIDYKIALTKKTKKADFVISTGTSGNKTATIIEKQRDPDITHPYNRSRAIASILGKLPPGTRFNQRDFESYCFVNGIKKSNNDYYYKGLYSGAGQFSEKIINDLAQAANSKTLRQWRSQYRQHLRKNINTQE